MLLLIDLLQGRWPCSPGAVGFASGEAAGGGDKELKVTGCRDGRCQGAPHPAAEGLVQIPQTQVLSGVL